MFKYTFIETEKSYDAIEWISERVHGIRDDLQMKKPKRFDARVPELLIEKQA